MSVFFESLGIFEMVLFIIAASSTIILVLQTIFAFAGTGDDVDMADGSEVESGGNETFDAQGLRLFTVRGVVAFLCLGSWIGFIAMQAGIHEFIALLFAAAAGTAGLFGIAKLMQFLMGLHQDGTLKLANAIGQTGTVYIRIPEAEKGVGKVNVTVQERFCEFDAVTESSEAIKTGERVYVTDVRTGNVLVVERVSK